MTHKLKLAVLAVAAIGVITTSTQAASYTGDLVVGFTSKTGSDVVFDLGLASTLFNNESWNLGASGSNLLSGFNLSTVNWGVIGDKNVSGTRTAWTTTDGTMAPLTLANTTAWGNLDTPTKSIYQNFATGGAGDSISILATDDNSWNNQTISGGLTVQYVNAYENPNVIGTTSDSLYSVAANGSSPVLLGNFSLNGSGVLTFNAVPEPATWGLAAGMALLLLSFRRGSFRKA